VTDHLLSLICTESTFYRTVPIVQHISLALQYLNTHSINEESPVRLTLLYLNTRDMNTLNMESLDMDTLDTDTRDMDALDMDTLNVNKEFPVPSTENASFFNNPLFSDVIIKQKYQSEGRTQTREYYAHKAVLCMKSKFFLKQFSETLDV